MCVCVLLCCVLFIQFYFVLLRKKEYKMKYKKYVFFAYGQISVFWKFILDLITSLLNLENLANIKINHEIYSWELTVVLR